ncbi:MAG: transporter substrate-binding domain-containing protein [Devosiaceae bacterium]
MGGYTLRKLCNVWITVRPFLPIFAALCLTLSSPAWAQTEDSAAAPDQDAETPAVIPDEPAGLSNLRFINPRARTTLPEPMPGPVLRFVVADDYPPFAFIDGAGRLAGMHIDLVRGVCAQLDLPCTLQARRFDQVLGAVDEDPTNLVLVAGLAVSDEMARQLTFSRPYYRFAGRFVARFSTASQDEDWMGEALVGVVQNTAHAAFLRDVFSDVALELFPTQAALLRALRQGDVTHGFGDGVDLAFWLAGEQSGQCCNFVGGPFYARDYFGEGLAFAIPQGQPELVQALNAALARLENSGDLERIMLTAFPLDPLGQ